MFLYRYLSSHQRGLFFSSKECDIQYDYDIKYGYDDNDCG